MIQETTKRLEISQAGLLNAAGKAQSPDKMGKQDFMNLFMFELSNQNPLDPMDSSKMMASLAQLGGMEQMQNVHAELQNITRYQKQMTQMQALNYVNKEISVPKDTVTLEPNKAAKFSFSLTDGAEKIHAEVTRLTDGALVRNIELGKQTKGNHDLIWNGRDNAGKQVAAGDYKVQIQAVDSYGKISDVKTHQLEKVEEVRFEGDTPLLKVGKEFIPFQQIFTAEPAKAEVKKPVVDKFFSQGAAQGLTQGLQGKQAGFQAQNPADLIGAGVRKPSAAESGMKKVVAQGNAAIQSLGLSK